jgi:hypothetical protein
VDIFPASRPAVPVWAVQAHHSPAPTSQQTQTPTETAQETATNATAQEPAEETTRAVPGLLLHAVVPVPGHLIVVRAVLTPMAYAAMRRVAVILAVIRFMEPERTAGGLVNRAMAQGAA